MSLVNPVAATNSPVAAAAAQLMPVMIGPMTTATAPVVGGGGGKDSRWLTLEVCREFARSKCSRSDEECKYAHPPPHVEIQNGRVMCCFDSIKGKCQRKDPPCKYLHPPQHLKEILLQNGRQNLINKNMQLQALQPILSMPPGMVPFVYEQGPSGAIKQTATIIPTAGGYSNGVVMPAPTGAPAGQYLTVLQQPSAHGAGHQYILPTAAATNAGYPCYGFSPTAFYPTIDGSSTAVSLHPGSLLTPTVTSNRVNVGTL